ncbi:putative quinol monooxygenase [Microbacterium sp. LWH3-1.2]|uniref:putative quinol monooxygenase n=1 Tax=Microbacterium sp. LWH3-1.2 TaxID=3135256 RepID=UPI00341733FA
MEPIVLYAEFTARPGARTEVEGLIRGYAEAVRQEPGNVVFDVYTRAEGEDRFVVFEVYRGQAAFDAHIGADKGAAFNDVLGPLIVGGASELSFLRPIEARL